MSTTTPLRGPPLTFLIALFPGFQLLDAAGPLDIFNFLSSPPYAAPIRMLFVGAQTHTPIPTKLLPSSVSSASQGWTYDLPAATGSPSVNESFNQSIKADVSFNDVLSSPTQYDILFIPGGVGSRVQLVNASGERELAIKPLIEFTREIAPRLKLGIMTVCTGSDILAHTGLLDGRRATTNMSRFEDVTGRHAAVDWVRGARWAKSPASHPISSTSTSAPAGGLESGVGSGTGTGNNGNETAKAASHLEIWTSAGVSAGIDLALAFVAEKFGGMELARDIAVKAEYDWSEPAEGEVCKVYWKYFGV
jgi:putative intracellular protease/amidase